MRCLCVLLLSGAASVSGALIPRDSPQVISSVTPSAVSIQPLASDIPVFVTHSWPLLSPDQALTNLHAKASATPSAVSLLPGVTLPTDLPDISQNLTAVDKHDGAEDVAASPIHVTEMFAENAAATTCTNPTIRREWRNMADTYKTGYVNAISCLMSKPSTSGLAGCKNRYDDLVALHQQMSDIIHNVGQFLPWHSYYLHIFYSLLQHECGYKGPLPWWDETKDAGNFNGAPPFTDQYEGHMPDGSVVCITSGVFANHVANIGPGGSNQPHCLSRGVSEDLSADITLSFVRTCNSYNDYNDMQNCQFFGPHAYGHDAVGGIMSDVQSSPSDPAFFLHHGFVDRNWRVWQHAKPAQRLNQIGGYTTQNCGSNCQPTTLDYVLSSLGVAAQVTVGQVMNAKGGYLCYQYDY